MQVSLGLWIFWQAWHLVLILHKGKEIQRLQQSSSGLNKEFIVYDKLVEQYRVQKQAQEYINSAQQQFEVFLYFLQQISEVIPEDVYFIKMEKIKNTVSIQGKSATHAHLTILLKQIEMLTRHHKNILSETKHPTQTSEDMEFILSFELPNFKLI